jgi:hypothetical protein
MTFARRTGSVVVTEDHSFTFAMDEGCLLIKIKGADYPCPLSAKDTHALLNLLWINRLDIIQGNKEAIRYQALPQPEQRKTYKRKISTEPL